MCIVLRPKQNMQIWSYVTTMFALSVIWVKKSLFLKGNINKNSCLSTQCVKFVRIERQAHIPFTQWIYFCLRFGRLILINFLKKQISAYGIVLRFETTVNCERCPRQANMRGEGTYCFHLLILGILQIMVMN